MNPWVFLAALIILPSALAVSLITIARTVVPAMPKITRALQGRGGVDA